MVKKKRKGKLFWILLVIALILLIVLYGFVIRKKFVVDPGLIDVVPGENSAAGADGEIASGVIDSDGVIDVGGGSSGSSSGGSSGGGSSDSGESNNGGVSPPPVIPDIE